MRRNGYWIAILTAPLLLFVATTGAGPLAWIPRPGLHDLYLLWLALLGNDGWFLTLLYSVSGGVACLPLPGKSVNCSPIRFLLLWIATPILTVFLISQIRPLFLPRYFVFLLPAIALLAAKGLGRVPIWIGGGVLVLILGLSLRSARIYYAEELNPEHEDWRSAASYVLSHAHEGDALIFHTAMGRMPYEYYRWDRPGPTVLFPHSGDRITFRDFIGHADAELLASASRPYARTWIVFSHNQKKLGAGPDALTGHLTQVFGANYAREETRNFPGVDVLLYSEGRLSQDP
jgi:hypothetical protein